MAFGIHDSVVGVYSRGLRSQGLVFIRGWVPRYRVLVNGSAGCREKPEILYFTND
jgi:hypothetical protein